jgi:hypothetical protein
MTGDLAVLAQENDYLTTRPVGVLATKRLPSSPVSGELHLVSNLWTIIPAERTSR